MANCAFNKLKDLDLSRDEVERIGAALKKGEFRKLLADYVEEVQDPENRKVFESEVVQLEKERGYDVAFLNPTPGYVIKTSVGGDQKCFINICTNENVDRPSATPAQQGDSRGTNWALPHSMPPPRDDVDNKSARCQVYDVIFHPLTLQLAHKHRPFYDMVNNTALDAIETNFSVSLDKRNLKFPKLQYKGYTHASIIRKSSDNKDEVVEREGIEKEMFDKIYPAVPATKKIQKKKKTARSDDKSTYTTPKYIIKHRSHVDMQEFTECREAKMHAAIPKELVVEVNLPLLKSSSDITLDVTEKTVQLTSEKPAKYKLNLTLPYTVSQDNGNAKFDKELKKLIVILPVKRSNILLTDLDSGVDSDHCPASPESEDSEESCERSVIRTKFLDENLHYSVPEYSCHVFDNVVAFTFSVKNIDDHSVDKIVDSNVSSIQMKFTTVSSGFYTVNYAVYLQFPDHAIDVDETSTEIWDNNMVLSIPIKSNNIELKSYLYGLDENNLELKYIEEPSILHAILQTAIPEEEPIQQENSSQENAVEVDEQTSTAINIQRVQYESSGDELSPSFSPSKSKGILKRLSSHRYFVGRSVSESSLDDFITDSTSNTEDMSTSLKKTVRFNDVITRQLYRSNSSILGQKKKNQRKARNKKRAQERRASESEASEVEDKKDESKEEGDEANDIFHMDLNF